MFPCKVELDAFNSELAVVIALSMLPCRVLEEAFKSAVKLDSKEKIDSFIQICIELKKVAFAVPNVLAQRFEELVV